METKYSVYSGDIVNVLISSSNVEKSIPIGKRFSKSLTIKDIKDKLEVQTGACSSTMKIHVYDKDDKLQFELDDDAKLLGSYPVDTGMRFHVEDAFVLKKMVEDDTTVEKFEMSVEEYEKRDDTLRAYLEKNKLGKYNPEEMAKREADKKKEEEADQTAAGLINIGDRCEVCVPAQPIRRAKVMFVGKTKFKPGWWVGVRYDEPMGKNDGSISGVRYFECEPNYGGFIKPAHIKVGDYPEEDFGLEDEF